MNHILQVVIKRINHHSDDLVVRGKSGCGILQTTNHNLSKHITITKNSLSCLRMMA